MNSAGLVLGKVKVREVSNTNKQDRLSQGKIIPRNTSGHTVAFKVGPFTDETHVEEWHGVETEVQAETFPGSSDQMLNMNLDIFRGD